MPTWPFTLTFSISFNPLASSTDEETEARETTELVQGYTVSGTFKTRQVKSEESPKVFDLLPHINIKYQQEP